MTAFVTGGTGYLGGYVVTELLQRTDDPIWLLMRAEGHQQAVDKLWRGLQLHLDGPAFAEALPRFRFAYGDLHAERLGFDDATWDAVRREADSVIHIAASLNRKSARACLNTNLRGTLSVIELAQAIRDTSGLRRFSHVSTTAVAGTREHEVVHEDEAIDWERSDYDPYGRTKKFCEHMVRRLLPDTPKTFFRPSTVLGDSRHPRTTQFDMVRAFVWLADLPAVPFDPDARMDIVPADYVGRAVAELHLADDPAHDTYHLAAGVDSPTFKEVTDALAAGGTTPPRFAPWTAKPFELAVRAANRAPRGTTAQYAGALLKVFWPYLTYDTVFANDRVVQALGERPTPFPTYAADLYRWTKEHGFRYPHEPLPASLEAA